jgi:hypothetical protein
MVHCWEFDIDRAIEDAPKIQYIKHIKIADMAEPGLVGYFYQNKYQTFEQAHRAYGLRGTDKAVSHQGNQPKIRLIP